MENYQDLTRDWGKSGIHLWQVVHIVIGTLGAVCNLEEGLIKLNINKKEIPEVQVAVLLELARILINCATLLLVFAKSKTQIDSCVLLSSLVCSPFSAFLLTIIAISSFLNLLCFNANYSAPASYHHSILMVSFVSPNFLNILEI